MFKIIIFRFINRITKLNPIILFKIDGNLYDYVNDNLQYIAINKLAKELRHIHIRGLENLYRDDKYSIVTTFDSDNKAEKYYKNNLLHRDDGPSIICYLLDEIYLEIYHKNGLEFKVIQYTDDKPEIFHIRYYGSLKIKYNEYYDILEKQITNASKIIHKTYF